MIRYNRSASVAKLEEKSVVEGLQRGPTRSLLELSCFLLICIGAHTYQSFNLFAVSSEPVRQLLGCPPPAYLVTIALAVYCFSSAVLTLTAMASDRRPADNWNHLGYRSAFFVFYSFSGAVADNFLAVLLVGLLLYGLEQCHVWSYSARGDHHEKAVGEKL